MDKLREVQSAQNARIDTIIVSVALALPMEAMLFHLAGPPVPVPQLEQRVIAWPMAHWQNLLIPLGMGPNARQCL